MAWIKLKTSNVPRAKDSKKPMTLKTEIIMRPVGAGKHMQQVMSWSEIACFWKLSPDGTTYGPPGIYWY